MEELKPYIVEFNQDRVVKPRVYSSNYIIRAENCWPVVIITYNKCNFFVNNKIWKA